MFTVTWTDSMGHGRLNLDSVAAIRDWSRFNGKVLGEPQLHVPTFAVELTAGGAVSAEVLRAIQPEDSDALYRAREAEARRAIAGVRVAASDADLHEGAANVVLMRHMGRQQERG